MLPRPRRLDRVVGAGILELGPGDAADFELRFVALELLGGLRLGRARLRELGLCDVELGIALAELQVRELRLGGLELLLGLPLRRRFLVVLELEERCLRGDRLSALNEQALEPPGRSLSLSLYRAASGAGASASALA